MITYSGLIGRYECETFEEALKSLIARKDKGIIDEKDIMKAIIQLFHQIPEKDYNDIIDQL